ncbi:MFS general substrate transporter [Clavulina sp. PMI_390]|nr:MFS general substrate transporter [Clavulina sp. PMI_390]
MADVEKGASPTSPSAGLAEKAHQEDSVSIEVKKAPSISIPEEPLATTRLELWSWYLYYIGNNGLAGFNFGPSAFQNLLYLAATCDDSGNCTLPFAGTQKSVTGYVLDANGISFSIQAVIFLIIGAWADYGTWRPNILTAFTIAAVAISFAWLGVEQVSKWQIGTGLYIVGLITYQGALTFWTAAFPGLVRNLPKVRDSAIAVANGEKTFDEHMELDSLERNRLSNVSFGIQSASELVILAVMVGILKALHSDESTENNTKAFSVLIAFSGGVWLLCALPWFFLEKRRPGLSLPPGTTLFTIGFLQTYAAIRECYKLKQTFLYLIVYFLLGDVLNTTVTVIGTLQNSLVVYSTLQLTYLLLVGIATQMKGRFLIQTSSARQLVSSGCYFFGFWFVQQRFKIPTKSMLLFNAFWILILTLWGFIGIWSPNFGFKHVWEIWLYQGFYGLLVCPWYAYSQTMITEVIPPGQEFLFFALFSIVGKSTSFIGPFVCSAITSDTSSTVGRLNTPFAFLFALGAVSTGMLFFVDVKKSRIECREFGKAEREKETRAPVPGKDHEGY